MSQFDRLNRISDKLNSTSISPKNSKFQFLQSRVADLNEHLDEVVDQTTKKFNIIKENVKINFYKKTIL
jgi:hypothetical protein